MELPKRSIASFSGSTRLHLRCYDRELPKDGVKTYLMTRSKIASQLANVNFFFVLRVYVVQGRKNTIVDVGFVCKQCKIVNGSSV
jgi:hypothetical protein